MSTQQTQFDSVIEFELTQDDIDQSQGNRTSRHCPLALALTRQGYKVDVMSTSIYVWKDKALAAYNLPRGYVHSDDIRQRGTYKIEFYMVMRDTHGRSFVEDPTQMVKTTYWKNK